MGDYAMKKYSFRLNDEHSKYIITIDGKETILTDPNNHKHNIEEVKDVVVINDIPCYVYQNEQGKYSLRPAFDGSGMAIDAYCHDIDSWGKYGDFLKITCASCKQEWYINARHIPDGDTFEAICPKCGALIKKKRV